ncbi:MAG TPA: helix-turn-helix transcriptional regulator [Pseudonocardiaceae bacterium]|nr:helix-turn-helix transcriptional regulator [Pseudonocardiaceae bacterium]
MDSPEGAAEQPAQRLATELRALRAASGCSLKQLESELHVSDSSLSRYFSGRAVPPWQVVEQLAGLTGADSGPIRPLWETAWRDRRTPAVGAPAERPAEPARRGRVPRMAIVVLVTALVSGGLGLLAGALLFGGDTRAPVAPVAQDDACRDWPWPSGTGQQVVPAAHPHGHDHVPDITLVTGTVGGRMVVWARIAGAHYGDRVWLDWSTNSGQTWTQCGPFPVTSATGVTRAAGMAPGRRFRACGDTPIPAPGSPRDACTDYW